MVSQGKDRKVGPVGGVLASLKARRTAAGTSAAWWISWLHLVYCRVICTRSPESVGSLSIIRVSELPAVSTTGVPAAEGVVKGADAVGQTARYVDVGEGRPARSPGITVGHAYGRALLKGLNVLDFRESLGERPSSGFRWCRGFRKMYSTPSAISIRTRASLPVISGHHRHLPQELLYSRSAERIPVHADAVGAGSAGARLELGVGHPLQEIVVRDRGHRGSGTGPCRTPFRPCGAPVPE